MRIALNALAALVFAFLVLPLLIVIPVSFSSAPHLMFPPPGWSLQWYGNFFTDSSWIAAALRSLVIGGATMLLATAMGTLLALSLVRGRYPGRALLTQIATAPLIIPAIVYAVAIYGVLAPLRLVGDWQAILLGHTVHALPFVVIVVAAALRTVDPAQEQAAMGLGASRLGALWRVTIPQIRSAILSAAFLAFIASFDELVIALFLGGVNRTLPMKMFENIQMEIDPTVAAASVLQIALATLVLAAAQRFGSGARVTSPLAGEVGGRITRGPGTRRVWHGAVSRR